jgi:hypothetical protein
VILPAFAWAMAEQGKRMRLTYGIDYAAVNAVVDATHRYKEIFYTDK